MKKLLFILATLISLAASAQPGPVNAYRTRVRYWQVMSDSLQGLPNDTFNLRTPRAISYGWNNYEWLARKNNVTYAWNVSRQVWEPQVSSVSTVSIINDSTLQICNNNSCDTFSVNINPATITNVSIINDSTLLVCNINSCDTIIFNTPPGPPLDSTRIINDSTIVVCSANGCDTLIVNVPPNPPLDSTRIINDSTIIVCNANGCDTLVINTNPITTTTIINDSTIQICNANGTCDTVTFSSQITNISIINDTTVQVCGSNILGPEQIVNGGFIGSAGGWELGSLWAYDANDIVHSFGSTQPTAQSGGLVEGGTYRVTANIGGANGTVAIHLDAGTSQTYNAGAGTVTFTGVWNTANNYKIVLTPSNDFDGSITDVSVRQVLPNCDTIQTVPTVFRDTVHIFVESPLHARNDSTFYITRSTKQDSGFLSNDDFAYFWHKVDSLYYHPSPLGEDSFFYNNGDTTGVLWYVNDVVANGIISGGQVVYSGTPYVYNITPAVYRINGIRYTSPATQVTIDSANPTLPRTDVFYVDSSGHAAYLAGIASAIPLKPQVDQTWQIELTSLDIPVNGTPGLDTTMIYNENAAWPVEWTPVTNLGTTTNPDNISTSWVGAKSVDVTNWNNSDYVQFTAGAPVDLSTKVSIVGYIKLKQSIPSATTIRLLFVNGSVIVSSAVVITVNPSDITNWQAFSLPLSTFTLTNQSVTGVRITYVRPSSGAVHAGVFLDYIYLQSGIQATPNGNNALINVFRRPGTDSVMGTYQNGTVSYQFKDSSGITASAITAGNGLTDSANTIIMGGLMYKHTLITQNSFLELITSALNGSNIVASATNGGTSIVATGTGTSAIGVLGNSMGGGGNFAVGVQGYASALGFGLSGYVDGGGIPLDLTNFPSSTSTVISMARIRRESTGTPVNGMGESIDLYLKSNNVQTRLSNQIISKWTDATDATRTSQFSITGVDAGTTRTLATADGNGGWTMPGAGNPSSTLIVNNTTGYGVNANATTGNAIISTVTGTAVSGDFIVNNTSTNTIIDVISLRRQPNGNTPAAGIGAGLTFDISTNGGAGTKNANKLTSSWTDATDATRTSQFSLTGVNTAVTNTLITVGGDGATTITGNGAGNVTALTAIAANTGNGVVGTGGFVGVLGTSSQSAAVRGTATGSAIAVLGTSVDGEAGSFGVNPSSTNTVVAMGDFGRNTSGTAGDGIGGSLDFIVETTTSNQISNQLITKWTTAANATRTSQLSITGVKTAVTQTLVTIDGDGTSTFLGPSSPTNTVRAINTTGVGVSGEVTSGTGIQGIATTGIAGNFGNNTASNTALNSNNTGGGYGAVFTTGNSSTNTVLSVASINRLTTGTAANGIGGSLDFGSSTTVQNQISNQFISKWTDATNATRTSQAKLTGVLSAVTVDLMTWNADGSVQWRPISATAASAITPAEGMVVMVSSTNGTFTSIGFWGYQNGAWHAF